VSIVYSHIRKDSLDVFYIGVGINIKRAYSVYYRNKYWHNIVNSVGYFVTILYDGITSQEAHEIEKKLILQYGRKDLGTGPLVNVTNGGDGVVGFKWTIEQRQAKSGTKCPLYGRKQTTETISTKSGERSHLFGKKGRLHPMYGKTQTDEAREQQSIRLRGNKYALGAVRTPEEKEKLRNLMLGNKHSLGYVFTDKQRRNLAVGHFKKIKQYDKTRQVFIQEWNSIKLAADTLFLSSSSITHCLKGEYSHAGGFHWQYS